MLIHSVTPPHLLIEQPEQPSYRTRSLNGAFVEGYDTPQGFCMTRLNATDPSLYLKAQYAPGSLLPPEQQKN